MANDMTTERIGPPATSRTYLHGPGALRRAQDEEVPQAPGRTVPGGGAGSGCNMPGPGGPPPAPSQGRADQGSERGWAQGPRRLRAIVAGREGSQEQPSRALMGKAQALGLSTALTAPALPPRCDDKPRPGGEATGETVLRELPGLSPGREHRERPAALRGSLPHHEPYGA